MIWRIMAALVAVVLIALLVQDIPLASYLRETEESRLTTALERDGFVLAGRSQDALVDVTPESTAAITQLAHDYAAQSDARLVIVDADGVAIATSDEGDTEVGVSYASRPEFASALAGTPASGERVSETLGGEILYAAVPVLAGNETVGAVRVSYDDRTVTVAVSSKIVSLAIVGLTTAILAALIGFILARSITLRLRLLRDATERFSAGDRSVRADETSGAGELRSVASSFNGMAERIDGLIEQQRAFAGDASHQLRTPLTALRLRLERARELTATDPDAAAERIVAAENELDRLDNLIEGLLVLSRSETSAPTGPVDLSAIAVERVESWQALAEESGSSVVYIGPTDAAVTAVPTAVDQIIDNLVDNALRAGGDGTHVVVQLIPGADRTALHVVDDGPGLTPEQRERAFDRFWRGRNDDQGSGLGLAIVAQLARASGATIELREADGGGVDAVVRFAAARSGSGSGSSSGSGSAAGGVSAVSQPRQ